MSLYDRLKSFEYNSLDSNIINIRNRINNKIDSNTILFDNGYLNGVGILKEKENEGKYPKPNSYIIHTNLFEQPTTKIIFKNIFENTGASQIISSLYGTNGIVNPYIFATGNSINHFRTFDTIYSDNRTIFPTSKFNAFIHLTINDYIIGESITISTGPRKIIAFSVYALLDDTLIELLYYSNYAYRENAIIFDTDKQNIHTKDFFIDIEALQPTTALANNFILSNIYISGKSEFFKINNSINLNENNIVDCKSIQVDEIRIAGKTYRDINVGQDAVTRYQFDADDENKVLYVDQTLKFGKSILTQDKLLGLNFKRSESNQIPYIDELGILTSDSKYTIARLSNINQILQGQPGIITTDGFNFTKNTILQGQPGIITTDGVNFTKNTILQGEPGIITTDGVNFTKNTNMTVLNLFNQTTSNIMANQDIYTSNIQTNVITLNGTNIGWNNSKLHYTIPYNTYYSNEFIQNEVYDAYSIYPPDYDKRISSNIINSSNCILTYSNNIQMTVSVNNTINSINSIFEILDYNKNIQYFISQPSTYISIPDSASIAEKKIRGKVDISIIQSLYPSQSYNIETYNYGFEIKYILNKYIYPKYVLISIIDFESSPKEFRIYGTSNNINYKLYDTIDTIHDINFKPNSKKIIKLTNFLNINYNTFSINIKYIYGNVKVCKIAGFAIFGDDLVNNTTLSYKSKYTEFIMNGKVGINNNSPNALLSINNEPNNFLKLNSQLPSSALVHLNFSDSDKIERGNLNELKCILRMYRPCDNNNLYGTFVNHMIGAHEYSNSNIMTEYSINLSRNSDNEGTLKLGLNNTFRIFSDDRVLINLSDINISSVNTNQGIHIGNSVNIYDIQNSTTVDDIQNISTSNCISIIVKNLTDSINLILPTSNLNNISSRQVLTIKSIDSSNIHTQWTNINFENIENTHIYLGEVNTTTQKYSDINNFPPLLQTNKIVIGSNTTKIENENINENAITFQGNIKGYGQIILDYNNDINANNRIKEKMATNAILTNGNIFTTGSIYALIDISTDSDIRYKYNFSNIQNPCQIIKCLNGYTFNRNDTDLNRRFTGLIAQELQKVLPEAIHEKEDGKLRIFYGNLAGLFVEAFKDIYNELDLIKKKIE